MNRKLKTHELGRKNLEEYKKAGKFPVVVILDNIRSSHNVGSVFRTCDAFLIEKLLLCGITATPPNRDVLKTAIGASESVTWEHINDIAISIQNLKKEGYTIISIEQTENSLPLDKFTPETNGKYALVFGNEVKGVQQNIINESDLCLEIPQYGTKHSFNISVSTGIVLWEIINKIKKG